MQCRIMVLRTRALTMEEIEAWHGLTTSTRAKTEVESSEQGEGHEEQSDGRGGSGVAQKRRPLLSDLMELHTRSTLARFLRSVGAKPKGPKPVLCAELQRLCTSSSTVHQMACKTLLAHFKNEELRSWFVQLRRQGRNVPPTSSAWCGRKDDMVAAFIRMDRICYDDSTKMSEMWLHCQQENASSQAVCSNFSKSSRYASPPALDARSCAEPPASQGLADRMSLDVDASVPPLPKQVLISPACEEESAVPEEVSFALVALGSASDPWPLRHKLVKKWAKRGRKRLRRQGVKDTLLRALQELGKNVTVRELRCKVATEVGLSLESPQKKLFFDRLVIKYAGQRPRAAPQKRRRRFVLATQQ